MKKVLIYGNGGVARMLLEEAEKYGALDPAAFVADSQYIGERSIRGIPVVEFEKVTEKYPPDEYEMIAAFGFGKMRARAGLYDKAGRSGYTLANYISPGAFLESGIRMGDNNIILSGARLGFDGVLGSDNIIRQNVYLGHEFTVGSHNIFSVGCVFGGRSSIHDLSYFGLSVTAASCRKFGTECLIGMGSVVTRDIDAYATAYGSPAKVVSYHKDDGVCVEFR